MKTDLQALAERMAKELAARDVTAALSPERRARSESGGENLLRLASAPDAQRSSLDAPTALSAQRSALAVRRIADYIDHTLLKAEATAAEIDVLCDEARENRFAAVCVNPVWVDRCARRLAGSGVGIATVIGFPLGASRSETKAFEAELAVRLGATELDMVAAIGHIKGGDWTYVHQDIVSVVRAARGTLVKVIIESAALTPMEIIKASALAKEAGAQYVKTSTGFHSAGGASAESVALMRLAVGDALGVKASGGVRDCSTALRMIASGATRIGTSSGVAMAQCLGPGPLPVRELLSLADGHVARCTTGTCDTTAPEPARAY
jgi:deoxyribose-phosphate aldolase